MTSAVPAAAAADGTVAPQSVGELFFAFMRLAMQGFGGVLPVAQRELVERKRWLTREQFVEMLAISQVLPGPNVINLALMFGDRAFGLRGAMSAFAGMMLAPTILVLSLTALYGHFAHDPAVTGALRGMGAVAAGLILSTGVKLLGTLGRNPMGRPICAGFGIATILAIAWLRVPLAWVILGLGSLAITVALKKLPPQ
jgi:chromate transporter